MFSFLKKNNKGSGWSIIRVLCYLLLMIAFFAAVDAVVLMGRMAILSYNMMYTSKQLSVNGGLSGTQFNNDYVITPITKAAQLAGLEEDEWHLTIYSDGLSGGKTVVCPNGNSGAIDSNRDSIGGVTGTLSISKGFNSIQTAELIFNHKWEFCPILKMLNLETPITISFNYRSEYIRPASA